MRGEWPSTHSDVRRLPAGLRTTPSTEQPTTRIALGHAPDHARPPGAGQGPEEPTGSNNQRTNQGNQGNKQWS
jgi:hypothetical protein